jgi:hypothetical protein
MENRSSPTPPISVARLPDTNYFHKEGFTDVATVLLPNARVLST